MKTEKVRESDIIRSDRIGANVAFRQHPRWVTLRHPECGLVHPLVLSVSWDLAPSRLDHTIAASGRCSRCSCKIGPGYFSLSYPNADSLQKFGIARIYLVVALPSLFRPIHNNEKSLNNLQLIASQG